MTIRSGKAIEEELKWRKLDLFYPETGQLRRELYVKHMEFFDLGASFNERLFMAANRVGKTEGVGAYECALHLTGRYPAWWKGRRFNRPISVWAAGQSAKTCRDIIQEALLGPGPYYGTGMLPADSLLNVTPKPGIPEAVETIYVKHATGGRSELQLKSYDQGVESFYGTKKDVIWLDEEAEQKIYVECLTRTLSTVPGEPNGIILFTFTPLWGMTKIVQDYLEAKEDSPKRYVSAEWSDAPHLSPETRAELYKSIPAYQRDARTRGIPQLGSGAIYKFADEEILVAPFAIPDHWPRGFGLDVGWNRTAAIWGAEDREQGMVYLYSEHYRAHDEPHVHTEAIKARGNWIPGVIDPASRGRSQRDGSQLIELYRREGLNLVEADNAVEAGLYACEQRMSAGRLKVFTSLSNWYSEFRMYRRDENGKVVKERDHLMDAMRYLVMSGRDRMRTKPQPEPEEMFRNYVSPGDNKFGWMLH